MQTTDFSINKARNATFKEMLKYLKPKQSTSIPE
jgi:hypothetical protein